MRLPEDLEEAGPWTKAQRIARGLSAQDLADRINGLLREAGDPFILSQQNLSKFEQGKTKRKPSWLRYIVPAFRAYDDESCEDPHLSMAPTDNSVSIRLLPTFAGMGGAGLDDETEFGVISFSRDLIQNELRIPVDALLAMVVEGNSMEPHFCGGDQILVDTRRLSLSQPGAFCLWDGDGYVVKFLEKVTGSEPSKVRVISANPLYSPSERLADEINLIGRVVWFGRRVH